MQSSCHPPRRKSALQPVMRRIVTTTLALVAFAASAGLGAAQLAKTPGQAALSEDPLRPPHHTLRMGTATNYPPFEYRDERIGTDEIIGFDIAIARYIAQKLGYTLTLKDMAFNELLPALQARQLDFAMAAITPTPERLQKVAFSDVYFESQNTIVSRQTQPLSQVSELAAKRVGVQLGSIQAKYAQTLTATLPGMTLISYPRVLDLLQALQRADIDATIVEDKIAEVYLEDDATLVASIIPNVEPMGSAIAFPKDSELVDEFNRILQEMRENGELDRLIRQWFSLQ